MTDKETHRHIGTLVAAAGKSFPLKICKSNYGFYIGTRDELGDPFSRESAEYWARAEDAEIALRDQSWTQRRVP